VSVQKYGTLKVFVRIYLLSSAVLKLKYL